MKTTVKFAIAAMLAVTAFIPARMTAEEKQPATEEKEPEPVAIEAVGTLSKDGEKIKFRDEAGKDFLVTKNNTEKVTPFIGKKVKITGKSKTKMLPTGKPLDMVVYVNKIAEAEAPAPEPAKK